MATLAENVKYYREKAGLSQDGLARKTGITTTGIGNIEQGRVMTPRLDKIGLIADALGVTIDDLRATNNNTHLNRA